MLPGWQLHHEPSRRVFLPPEDRPAVILGDLLCNRQAKTGAARLIGRKRLKQSWLNRGRGAGARIADGQLKVIAVLANQADCDVIAFRDGRSRRN
jgi:hypothetical protein